MSTYGQRKDTQSQVDEHITDSAGTSGKKVLVMGRDGSNVLQDIFVDSSGRIQLTGLVPHQYDYIGLVSYSGSNLTGVEYRSGGAGGTLVASLALGYSGSNLISVTKT